MPTSPGSSGEPPEHNRTPVLSNRGSVGRRRSEPWGVAAHDGMVTHLHTRYNTYMRLIVEVRDQLHQRLKTQAQAEGRPQSAIVRELIEQYLEKAEKARKESHGHS